MLWYSSLVVILLAGIGLTAFSREQRQDQLGGSSQTPPRANQDHWHTAFGVYVCDKWLDPVTNQNDPQGIHTHGDGVVHAHPSVSAAAGKKATFGKLVSAIDAKLTSTSFTWPAGGDKVTKKSGDKCGETPAQVKVWYDGKEVSGDPKDVRLTDRGKLVVAFVPADVTLEKIGEPPSVQNLDNLNDLTPSEANTTGSSVAPVDTTASTEPGAPPAAGEPPSSAPSTEAPPTTAAPPSTAAGK